MIRYFPAHVTGPPRVFKAVRKVVKSLYVIEPSTLELANAVVSLYHRHHKPFQGHRFSLILWTRYPRYPVGIVLCGRPVSRKTEQNLVLEITRCATDGTHGAISLLYAHVIKAAKAMGFHSVQTFTLPVEGGGSLRACGFEFLGEAGGGDWSNKGARDRRTDQPMEIKHKWIKRLV